MQLATRHNSIRKWSIWPTMQWYRIRHFDNRHGINYYYYNNNHHYKYHKYHKQYDCF